MISPAKTKERGDTLKHSPTDFPTARLAAHPFFTSRTDPESGMESFVLTERVAPVQMAFYFTNPSVSADEKWLWFYAGFPPSPHMTLGVVGLDPDNPFIVHFPGAAFTSASPMVAPAGDACYFCQGPSVWRQPIGGDAELVCSLDEKWINFRPLNRLATHLTLSADGKQFLLDGALRGNHTFVALGDMMLLKCRTVKEAIAFAEPFEMVGNAGLADATGEMVLLECVKGHRAMRRPENRIMIATSFFKSPDMLKALDEAGHDHEWAIQFFGGGAGKERYQIIERLLQASEGRVPEERLKEVFSSHEGSKTASPCNAGNVNSAMFFPRRRRCLAAGRFACSSPWREYGF
jgi:hypothetical protein